MSCCFVILTHCQERRRSSSGRRRRPVKVTAPLRVINHILFSIQFTDIYTYIPATHKCAAHRNHPLCLGAVHHHRQLQLGAPLTRVSCLSVWRLNDGCFPLKGNTRLVLASHSYLVEHYTRLEWIPMTLLAFMPNQAGLKCLCSRPSAMCVGQESRSWSWSLS